GNVNCVLCPGFMSMGWLGKPPSRNWTLCVKLSLLVHVTVVFALTVIAVGSNLYEGGRLTVFVGTGELDADPPEHAMTRSAAAARAAAARRCVNGSAHARRAARAGPRPTDRHEDECECDQVEYFADRV